MGAGSSIPDRVDAATAKGIAREHWDEAKFAAAADAEGCVGRAAFLAAAALVDAHPEDAAHFYARTPSGSETSIMWATEA